MNLERGEASCCRTGVGKMPAAATASVAFPGSMPSSSSLDGLSDTQLVVIAIGKSTDQCSAMEAVSKFGGEDDDLTPDSVIGRFPAPLYQALRTCLPVCEAELRLELEKRSEIKAADRAESITPPRLPTITGAAPTVGNGDSGYVTPSVLRPGAARRAPSAPTTMTVAPAASCDDDGAPDPTVVAALARLHADRQQPVRAAHGEAATTAPFQDRMIRRMAAAESAPAQRQRRNARRACVHLGARNPTAHESAFASALGMVRRWRERRVTEEPRRTTSEPPRPLVRWGTW